MIYLRFPSSLDDMVEYAEIKKPNYSDVLETALREFYNASLAQKYATLLAESLDILMDFPRDGLYYVNPVSETLFRFSEETNNWTDTKTSFKDYIIDSENKIWDIILTKHKFLTKVINLIQDVVYSETQKMFNVQTWNYICSFDLATYSVTAKDQITQRSLFFSEYFSKRIAKKIDNEVMKKLFSYNSIQLNII